MPLSILLQAGIPAIIKGLAEGLKAINTPVAQGASTALSSVIEAFGKGEISPEQLTEINRHVEKMQELESSERKDSIAQINESLRAEVASADPYVRRMRPTFGYIIAMTWAAQMFAIAYVIVFETNQAALVIEAVQSLGTIWAVGLSVLGIYVYKRSEEKKMDVTPTIYPSQSSTPPLRKPYNS
jgi:phosphopantothenate synthetase